MNFRRFLFNFLAILGFALFGAKSYGMDGADTGVGVRLGFADQAQAERKIGAEQRFSGPMYATNADRGYNPYDDEQFLYSRRPMFAPRFVEANKNIDSNIELPTPSLGVIPALKDLVSNIQSLYELHNINTLDAQTKRGGLVKKVNGLIQHLSTIYHAQVAEKNTKGANQIKQEALKNLCPFYQTYFLKIFGNNEENKKLIEDYYKKNQMNVGKQGFGNWFMKKIKPEGGILDTLHKKLIGLKFGANVVIDTALVYALIKIMSQFDFKFPCLNSIVKFFSNPNPEMLNTQLGGLTFVISKLVGYGLETADIIRFLMNDNVKSVLSTMATLSASSITAYQLNSKIYPVNKAAFDVVNYAGKGISAVADLRNYFLDDKKSETETVVESIR